MAKTVSTSKILNDIKQKAKGAWDDAKKIAPKKGFISLPPGIRNGVARLIGAALKMSEENERGQVPQVVLKFIVREPIDHEGSIQFKSHFIAAKTGDFPKSIREVLDGLSSDLQNLGVEQGNDGLPEIDGWPEMLADLQTAKPYFKFHTWQGKDADRVTIFIDGPCTAKECESFAEAPTEAPENAEEIVAAAEFGTPAPKSPPARKGPPPKKAPPAAADEPQAVEDEPQPVDDEPTKSIPSAGDRFYIEVKGEQLTCECLSVDEAHTRCTVQDEAEGGKKYVVTFEQIEKWNPST